MAEEINMSEVTEEIKNASEEELRKVIEKWFESTRTQGLKIGASMISAAVFGAIQKHLYKSTKPSLRDYQRCMDDIVNIISKQLKQNTKQNDSAEEQPNE